MMAESEWAPQSAEAILRGRVGRQFYGDSASPWREGRNRRHPKSFEQAAHDRDNLVKALFRDSTPEADELAETLNGCSKRNPCVSGGCPLCRRAMQKMFVRATDELFDAHDGRMVAANIVWRKGGVQYGCLAGDTIFARLNGRLRKALKAAGIPAVGGFDISANEHETGDFEPHWMPHAWLLAPAQAFKRGETVLREWFLSDHKRTFRPVQAKDFDGNPAGFAYALKTDFIRRDSLVKRILPDGSRSTFGTRDKPIGGSERVELALALDQAGLDARMFLRGYRLLASEDDVAVRRKPRPSASSFTTHRREVDRARQSSV
jgi:hypothetical protein